MKCDVAITNKYREFKYDSYCYGGMSGMNDQMIIEFKVRKECDPMMFFNQRQNFFNISVKLES